jgi:mTERF domain-containing protein, mitochondrial
MPDSVGALLLLAALFAGLSLNDVSHGFVVVKSPLVKSSKSWHDHRGGGGAPLLIDHSRKEIEDESPIDDEFAYDVEQLGDDDDQLEEYEYDADEELFDLEELPIVPLESSNHTTTTTTNGAPFFLDLSRLSENFAVNVSYFYLRDEIGLSDEAMWRVTYQASSVLGIKTAVIKKKVKVLQETMNLSHADVRSLLSLHPSILHLSADRNLSPTILFLVRSLDLGKSDLRHLVLRCPAILGYSRANLRAKLSFFQRLLGYSVEETRTLFMKEPMVIRSSVRESLIPHLRFFLDHVKLSPSDLRCIIMKHPKLLLYNIERNLYPKLNILNMTMAQTHKVLLSFPRYCDYSLDRTIAPVIKYLVDDLGFTADEVRAMMARYPRIISYTSALKSQVGFFRFEMGLSATTVKMFLRRSPSLVGLATDTIRAKLRYFSERLNLTNDDVKAMIGTMPQLLLLDVDNNVEHKIEYLSTELGVNVGRVVQKLPAVLAYSLERRITPRVKVIQRFGLSLDYCLPIVLQKTNENFLKWVLKQEEKMIAARKASGENIPTANAGARVTHWTR